MFKQGLSILFAVLTLQCVGQNLVPNPSFEQHTACPANGGDILLATPWFQPLTIGNSSDLFDVCGSSDWSVPNNADGFQFPNSGNAYAGIVTLALATSNYREYLEIELLDTLISGKEYCIAFYVSLADTCQQAIDKIGLYFSSDIITYNGNPSLVLPYIPQITNTNGLINGKQDWVLISGNYIANGGERFITIGNFYDDANTNYQNLADPGDLPFTYYYIDDVSVTCCDPSGTCTLSLPEPPEAPFFIPTLLSTNDVFYIKGADAPVNLTLYDARGRLVYKNEQYINDLPLVSYAEGIYFYVITLADGRTERGKLLIGK